MYSVYICDNDIHWLNKIEQSISKFQFKSDWLIEIKLSTSSPLMLLQELDTHRPHGGIYFLDIELKSELNGLELGQRIRKIDKKATIIFVTAHIEMVMETFRYRLQALDYIIKESPDINAQINSVLEYIYQKTASVEIPEVNSLSLKTTDGYHILNKNEIYYIETISGKHRIKVHAATKILILSKCLNDLAKELGNSFIYCDKGCLVNVEHISKIDPTSLSLLLDNGDILNCSIRAYRNIKKNLTPQ